jgi:hypothetical protein
MAASPTRAATLAKMLDRLMRSSPTLAAAEYDALNHRGTEAQRISQRRKGTQIRRDERR